MTPQPTRLPSSWWGPAVLAAAHYSREVGLEKWPKLGFKTRAMVVLDPEPRDCFAPRSLPATIFGPSERVSGAYVVYQQGNLKDAMNVQDRFDVPGARVRESSTTKLGLPGGTTKTYIL